jgi:hypothetical protein
MTWDMVLVIVYCADEGADLFDCFGVVILTVASTFLT